MPVFNPLFNPARGKSFRRRAAAAVAVALLPLVISANIWAQPVYAKREGAGVAPAIAVFALPASASGSVTVSAGKIEVTGNNVTLQGWDCRGYNVVWRGSGGRLLDCIVEPTTGSYGVQVGSTATEATSDFLMERCVVNGRYGAFAGTLLMINKAATGVTIRDSWFRGSASDDIDSLGSNVTFEGCLLEIGGWGNPTSHCDFISLYSGDNITIRNNCFYSVSQASGGPNGTTYGLTNQIRISPIGAGATISNVLVQNNLLLGYGTYGGLNPIEVTNANGGTTNVQILDNIIEPGTTNQVLNANTPASTISAWSGNLRYTDGGTLPNPLAAAASLPGTMVGVTQASATADAVQLAFAPAYLATSVEVARSSDGGSTWGAWRAVALTGPGAKKIGAMTPGTSRQLKLRGVNANGAGPETAPIPVQAAASAESYYVPHANGGSCYFTRASPFPGKTAAKKFVVGLDGRLLSTTGNVILLSNKLAVTVIGNGLLRFQVGLSTACRFNLTTPMASGAAPFSRLLAVIDTAAADVASGASVMIDGAPASITGLNWTQGTAVDMSTGTLALFASSTGTSPANLDFGMVFVAALDDADPTPNLADPAVRALWSPANILADASGPLGAASRIALFGLGSDPDPAAAAGANRNAALPVTKVGTLTAL